MTLPTYFILLLLSVLTGTSALTYEYADKNKLGYVLMVSILFTLLVVVVVLPKIFF